MSGPEETKGALLALSIVALDLTESAEVPQEDTDLLNEQFFQLSGACTSAGAPDPLLIPTRETSQPTGADRV